MLKYSFYSGQILKVASRYQRILFMKCKIKQIKKSPTISVSDLYDLVIYYLFKQFSHQSAENILGTEQCFPLNTAAWQFLQQFA